jgi:hypothetical protein
MFMGLNPSTADETLNDRTINREIAFARAWGFAGLAKWNAFGFRATKPRDMKAAHDPVGPDNDKYLVEMAAGAGIIVAAWGNDIAHRSRHFEVMKLLSGFDVHALRITKRGHAEHPLYIPGTAKPFLLQARA